jgi:hypothetical protein
MGKRTGGSVSADGREVSSGRLTILRYSRKIPLIL